MITTIGLRDFEVLWLIRVTVASNSNKDSWYSFISNESIVWFDLNAVLRKAGATIPSACLIFPWTNFDSDHRSVIRPIIGSNLVVDFNVFSRYLIEVTNSHWINDKECFDAANWVFETSSAIFAIVFRKFTVIIIISVPATFEKCFAIPNFFDHSFILSFNIVIIIWPFFNWPFIRFSQLWSHLDDWIHSHDSQSFQSLKPHYKVMMIWPFQFILMSALVRMPKQCVNGLNQDIWILLMYKIVCDDHLNSNYLVDYA